MAASLFARGKATTAFEPMGPTAGGNLVTVVASHSVTAALSADDVFQMIKVPNGAIIIDGYMKVVGDLGFAYEVGVGGDTNKFVTVNTVSATTTGTVFAFLRNLLPFKISVTANAANQFDTIDVKATVIAATVAQSWSLVVHYLVDDADGLL